ncbi:MAG: twin-arginine translocase subunit TatC, partial [Pirellulaceae bacterium]
FKPQANNDNKADPEAPPLNEEVNELDDLPHQMRIAPEEEPVAMLTWRRISASTEALKVEEVFMIWLKAGLIFGAIIASPGIFYHIWQFIAAGLYPHEQKYVWVFLPFSMTLFFGGASLAYFQVFGPVLDFLFSFNLMMGIDPRPRISEWMGFVLLLPLGFGLSFQLPLVMLMLNRIGLVSLESYVAQWRIAIVVIFGLSAFLTPAEPISMMMMAIPLTILYFGGIGLCRWMPRSRSPFGDPATG